MKQVTEIGLMKGYYAHSQSLVSVYYLYLQERLSTNWLARWLCVSSQERYAAYKVLFIGTAKLLFSTPHISVTIALHFMLSICMTLHTKLKEKQFRSLQDACFSNLFTFFFLFPPTEKILNWPKVTFSYVDQNLVRQ